MRHAALASLALLAAAPALAAEDDWPEIKSAPFGAVRPWGAFAHYGGRGERAYTRGVTLYSAGGALVARRLRAASGPAYVDWTDSRRCPQLAQVGKRLERLPLPALDVPAVGAAAPKPAPGAGDSYHLWADEARWRTGFGASLELRASDGSPLAGWMQTAFASLEPCWRLEQPVR